MVTPTTATLKFKGASGKDYIYSLYLSDSAINAKWSTSGTAGATSSDSIITPEPIELRDVSIITGPTVVFNLVPFVNGIQQPQMINIAANISTIQTRAFPSLRINGSRKLELVQS
jgi:hypothetical protein